MVAAANQKQLFALDADDDAKGAFRHPIRRSAGVTFTESELRALKETFGSVSLGIRSLVGRKRFEQLIDYARSKRAAAKESVSRS